MSPTGDFRITTILVQWTTFHNRRFKPRRNSARIYLFLTWRDRWKKQRTRTPWEPSVTFQYNRRALTGQFKESSGRSAPTSLVKEGIMISFIRPTGILSRWFLAKNPKLEPLYRRQLMSKTWMFTRKSLNHTQSPWRCKGNQENYCKSEISKWHLDRGSKGGLAKECKTTVRTQGTRNHCVLWQSRWNEEINLSNTSDERTGTSSV